MTDVRAPADADLQQDLGVAFPLGVEGRRSTTGTGRAVIADATAAADPALADEVAGEQDWHAAYGHHLRNLVAAEVRTGHAVAVAHAGLRSLQQRFEFERDGHRRRLRDVLAEGTAHTTPPPTLTIVGERPELTPQLRVPYRGQELSGDALHRQLDAWVDHDVVEASFAEAIRRVMAHPDWLDLSDLTVAVIGAGAEMGPLTALCGWRAEVLAIDLPHVTDRISEVARGGNATVHLPVLSATGEGMPTPGADLLSDTPELAGWLAACDGPLVIGSYAYADGADHVRVAVAADAIAEQVCRSRDEVSLAALATPTDVYAVPEALAREVQVRAAQRRVPLHERAARLVSGGALYRPSYDELVTAPDGRRYGLADAQVAQQGPNYALAKRLQQWRAVAARSQGVRSSMNVAPATSTRSVTKNRLLAAAYAGASRFGVEVFAPATSNMLMAALLVHDLRHDGGAADPSAPLDDPLDLFVEGAAHGGLWRTPWKPPSVLGIAAVSGLAGRGR